MRIAAVADLHGNLPEVPECDVLVICGDLGPPTYRYHHDPEAAELWLRSRFLVWCLAQPAKHVVCIAGNHDYVLEDYPEVLGSTGVDRFHYLQDSGCEIGGVKFWGSPWTPSFNGWAFMDDDDELLAKFERIPLSTEVLMTHGPPWGSGDRNSGGKRCGSKSMFTTLRSAFSVGFHPAWHFFGHIHEGHGQGGASWANVSLLDENYRIAEPVQVFKI